MADVNDQKHNDLAPRLRWAHDYLQHFCLSHDYSLPQLEIGETRSGSLIIPVHMMQQDENPLGSMYVMRISEGALSSHSDRTLIFQITSAILWFQFPAGNCLTFAL